MKFGETPKQEAKAYCPKCNVICFYEVGQPHYKWCEEILIPAPIAQRQRQTA